MKFNFNTLSIEKLLWLLLGVFIVISLIGFFILKTTISNIDIAQSKVETAQQLGFTPIIQAAEALSAENEEAKTILQTYSQTNEKVIVTFLKGGYLNDTSTYIDGLSGDALNRLKHLKVLWDSTQHAINTLRFEEYSFDSTYQETIQVPNNDSLNTFRTEIQNKVISIKNPAVVMARSFIIENAEELTVRKSALVSTLKSQLDNSESRVNYVIFIIILINALVFILIILAVRKLLMRQLQSLDENLSKINEGNFDVTINFDWKNEVHRVAEKVNGIAAKLKHATNFVKQVEKGELDTELEGIDEKSINKNSLEGALVDMRDQMKRVEKEEEIRKWSTGGLAKFVDILRSSNDNVNELSDEIISSLVEYTHSNQGGLYLLNDDNEDDVYLELISLYAFNQKKFEDQRYKLGEGLVGQTFLEKKTTYLLEVPHEYIKITSGLGGANPKAILVVPLQVNNEIFGIIELASFEEYQDYEIEFVEKLGESIASTIASVKNNQRTKKLLEESQALTEQMQSQEEEMRQNMEELSATQEEMARKEIEISAQITAINNTIGTVEYDIDGVVSSTNSIFNKNMEYSTDKLYDLSFKDLYSGEREIWSQIKSGQSIEGDFSFSKGDGSEILLTTSFTPVYNDENKISKVIQLITTFGTQANAGGSDVDQIEFALRQNLEELEITQEQLDKKLKFSEEKLSLFNRELPFVIIDQNNTIKEINEALITKYSLTKEEIIGLRIEKFLGEDILKSISNNSPKSTVTISLPTNEDHQADVKIIYLSENVTTEIKALIIWL